MTTTVRPHQPQIGRHDVGGRTQGIGVFGRERRLAHRGPRPTGIERIDAHLAGILQFLCQHLREAFRSELGDTVGAPEGTPLAPDTGACQHDGGVLRGLEQRQQCLDHPDRAIDIDLHDLLPQRRIILLEWSDLAQQARVVQQAIQTTELAVQGISHLLIILERCPFEVERIDGRLRCSQGLDLVVDFFQLGNGSAQQYHRRPMTRIFDCRFTPNAGPRPGHQNDPPFQHVVRGLIVDLALCHGDIPVSDLSSTADESHCLRTDIITCSAT